MIMIAIVNVFHLWERCGWFELDCETEAGAERTSPPEFSSSESENLLVPKASEASDGDFLFLQKF